MSIKNPSLKNIIYLAVLSIVLVFSLYTLFSDDAKSWFVVNKRILVNPVYGRVLTTGAGRNLASFKNDNSAFSDGIITDGSDGDTGALIMVPGDIIHFLFMVAVDDPAVFNNSELLLQGLAGDEDLRNYCLVPEKSISIAPVKFTLAYDEDNNEIYTYMITDKLQNPWQTISNVGFLLSDSRGQSDISVQIGISNVTTPEQRAEGGAYDGKYIFLLDIPIYYVDDSTNQNNHKYIKEDPQNPEASTQKGWILIERCVFVYTDA